MSNSRRSFLSKAALAAAIAPLAPLASFGKGLEDAIEKTPMASPPSDLKITDVKCAYSGGGLFIKIMTNQGLVGWGEAVDAIGGTYHLVQRMGRQLVGRSPLNPNAIFNQFRANPFGGPQGGMLVAVLSAFDAALWDLTGKALGCLFTNYWVVSFVIKYAFIAIRSYILPIILNLKNLRE
jgi:galactonate dehydratase